MKKVLTLIIFTFIGIYTYNNFATQEMLIGTYVNNNYDHNMSGEAITHNRDTLIIKNNNQFESTFFEKGTYKLKYSLSGTAIELTYDHGNFYDTINGEIIKIPNQGIFSTTINRLHFVGNLKITLNEDLNLYYEKIN